MSLHPHSILQSKMKVMTVGRSIETYLLINKVYYVKSLQVQVPADGIPKSFPEEDISLRR